MMEERPGGALGVAGLASALLRANVSAGTKLVPITHEASPEESMDLEAFDAVCERVRRALVAVLIEEEPGKLENGSGVLVRLAGIEFVLTAGHNVWHRARGAPMTLAVGQLPRHVVVFIKPGDGSVQRVRVPTGTSGWPEPDVAVIELSPRALLQTDRKPFEEAEIGFFASDSPPRRLVLGGFPSELVDVDATPLVQGVVRKPKLDLFAVTTVAHSMSGRRAEHEPPMGRGVHIFLSRSVTSREGGTAPNHSSEGMSGGPLVAPDENGLLVGLARSRESFEDGHDQWCEPVAEAVRILTEHEHADVAAAARRIVERCDAILRTET
jgi:hypothetical protein